MFVDDPNPELVPTLHTRALKKVKPRTPPLARDGKNIHYIWILENQDGLDLTLTLFRTHVFSLSGYSLQGRSGGKVSAIS